MRSVSLLEKLLDGVDVKWIPIEEVSEIYGGLTGKSKVDFENGNSKYITYKNIFNNLEVDFNNLECVSVNEHEGQHKVMYGDVLFTGSSETPNEAGMSASVTKYVDEPIYLNSFSFGIRFNKGIELNPDYSKYLFRTSFMRNLISKTSSGVTRYNVSKARFKKIKIPIPCPHDPQKSLEIQSEIARILDTFTSLIEELEKEISAREQQFEYYRDLLFSFTRP